MSDLTEFDGRFEDSGGNRNQLQARRADPGQATQIEQARAIAEVRAMVMIAMENPRDEERARKKMQRVCKMPALAERAFFRVPRGTKKDDNGNTVKGPDGKPIPEFVNGETINLARELARCWGNIDYSVREMSRSEQKGQSEMMAYAWDLEENVRPTSVFIVEHKIGKYAIKSNQQIYENNAGHAGRRLREMIFNVLPEWFKGEAIDLCHETLRQGDGKPIAVRIQGAIEAFGKVGVSVDMLQRKIGRVMGEATPEDLAMLRVILRSIGRGEVTVVDEFPPEVVDVIATKSVKSTAGLDQFEQATIAAAATPGPAAAGLRVAERLDPNLSTAAETHEQMISRVARDQVEIGVAEGEDDVRHLLLDKSSDPDAERANAMLKHLESLRTIKEVNAFASHADTKKQMVAWLIGRAELFQLIDTAFADTIASLNKPNQ